MHHPVALLEQEVAIARASAGQDAPHMPSPGCHDSLAVMAVMALSHSRASHHRWGTPGTPARPLLQLKAVAGAGLPGPLTNSLPLRQWHASTTGNGRTSPAPAEEANLSLKRYNTQRIKLCSDWRQLQLVVNAYGHHFNAINACAALVHLAQLGNGPQQPYAGNVGSTTIDDYAAYEALLQQLLQMACGFVPQLQARQVANVLWAAATLSAGYTGGHPRCVDLMMQLLTASAALLPWSKAQELANSIWAVATAKLPVEDSWLLQFLNSAETALPYTTCQDLATMLWALSELGVAPDTEWLGAFASRVRQLGHHMTHRDAGQILAGMARMGVNVASLDGDLLVLLRGRLLDASGGRSGIHGAAVQGGGQRGRRGESEKWAVSASQGLWAMARMSTVPPTAWMQQALAAIESRLHEFGPRELSTALWASVTLGQAVPPSLVRAVYACTLTQPSAGGAVGPQLLPSFCPQSLAELIWAISTADQAHKVRNGSVARPLAPPPAWTAAFLDAVSCRLAHGFTEQPTAMVLVSLARLGITPPPAWASAIITHVNTALRDISPQALTNCMWALATLGFKVEAGGLAALEQQLELTLQPATAASSNTSTNHTDYGQQDVSGLAFEIDNGGWGSQELSNTLWVLAKWQHRPSDRVMQLLLGRMRVLCMASVEGGGAEVRPQELANTMWALGKLGVQPSHAWLADVWSACAHRMGTFNSKDISQLVHALAKLSRRPPALRHPSPRRALQSTWARGNLLLPDESLLTHEEQAAAAAAAEVANQQRTAAIAANDAGKSLHPSNTGTARTTAPPPAPVLPHADNQAAPPAQGSHRALDWASLVLQEAAATLGRCSGQDLANLSWGLAQLGVRPGQAWCERLARELMTRGSAFTGSHLATCVWALGSMGYRPAPQSLLPLEGALFRRMPSLAPRELAACCWGFSSMCYRPDQEWLEVFASQCRTMAPEFTQQDWSVVVYSLSGIVESDKDAGIYLEDLFLSPQLAACLDQFGPSGVAILLYAASMLGAKSPRLMGRLLTAATRHMPYFSGRELAALITTCAKTGVTPDRAFFAAWVQEVAMRMQSDLSHTAAVSTAEGSIRSRPQGFGAPAAAAVTHSAAPPSLLPSDQDEPTPQLPAVDGIANLGVGEEMRGRQGNMTEPASLTPSMLAVSGWALATLGMRPKADWLQLYHAMLTHHARGGALGPKETHMTALALAAWERQVPYELVRALRLLTKQHKPMYTKAERWSINVALKTLRKVSTPPPLLAAEAGKALTSKRSAA